MKSPVGSRQELHAVQLEKGLLAYRCPETGGHYIPASAYMQWLGEQPARLPQLPPTPGIAAPREEKHRAYICPESGTIMIRFKVGHGFKFTVDRSITGGIWLDSGEWEALKSRNFHDEIHFIFTDPWQNAIRKDEVAAGNRTRLEERLGTEFLGRIDGLKDEILQNPHREEILAYLMNSLGTSPDK